MVETARFRATPEIFLYAYLAKIVVNAFLLFQKAYFLKVPVLKFMLKYFFHSILNLLNFNLFDIFHLIPFLW